MKRILALLLVLSTVLAFAGCTEETNNTPSTPASSPSSSATTPTGPYPDFEPTPVAFTAEEILEKAIDYIKDKKPTKTKHQTDSFDVVNYNWFEDTFIFSAKADCEPFNALGYDSTYLQVTVVRYTYEYQEKVTYSVTLSYAVPCTDNAQILAFAKDDLHRFASFRETTQRKVSYTIQKQEHERLTDADYQQLLTSAAASIKTKDNSKKSGKASFEVKTDGNKYCIEVIVKS